MKIVVCVKYVPDATADQQFESDNTVDRVAVAGELSGLDEYAVEQALQLKEKAEDPDSVTVTALTVGPEDAATAVTKALQMGADDGVQVADDAIAGSDALATSKVIAAAIKKIGDVDVVMCGMASTDGGMGVLPAMVAERLDLPQMTYGSVVQSKGAEFRVKRDGDAATEVIAATAPVVLSVTDQSGEPRIGGFKQIVAAKKKPRENWTLADLGLDAGEVGASAAWTAVEGVEARPPRTAGEIVTDEGGSGAKALAEFLASKKFI